MKRLFGVILVLLIFSCEGELDDGSCDIKTLAITASVEVNGEGACYDKGSLVHDVNNNLLFLELYSSGTNGVLLKAQFSVPAQGIQLNQTYQGAGGQYDGQLSLFQGSIYLGEDNYPQDPSLLKYAGNFNLRYQGNGEDITIDGDFSFEQP